MYRHFFKRAFDIVLSFFAIIVFALPMVVIAIVVRCDSKGPALFKQERVGKKKKPFTLLKFRTMRIDTPHDAPTHELHDPQHFITKTGKFLRKTSLDEIPQIFNIFVGQMSIIGPRPVLLNQTELIEERDKYGANDIRPGLTGWAQVNGRDILASSDTDKARFDGEYAQKITFGKDFKIFFKTVGQVFRGADIVEGDAVLKQEEPSASPPREDEMREPPPREDEMREPPPREDELHAPPPWEGD